MTWYLERTDLVIEAGTGSLNRRSMFSMASWTARGYRGQPHSIRRGSEWSGEQYDEMMLLTVMPSAFESTSGGEAEKVRLRGRCFFSKGMQRGCKSRISR